MIQRVSFTSIVFNVQCLSTLFPYFAYCAPPPRQETANKKTKPTSQNQIILFTG